MFSIILVFSLIIVFLNVIDLLIAIFLKQKIKPKMNMETNLKMWDLYRKQMMSSLKKISNLSHKKTTKNAGSGIFKIKKKKSNLNLLIVFIKIKNFLFDLIKLIVALVGTWIGAVGFALYKALAFLWPVWHTIIRYIPYFILVNVYEFFIWPEWYIAVFILVADIFWYFIWLLYNEEDEDYQTHMNRLNMIYLIIISSLFTITIILRLLYNYTWIWLPPWHSNIIQAIFDWSHNFELSVLKDWWVIK